MLLALIFLEATAVSPPMDFDLRDIPADKTGCSTREKAAKGDIIVCAQGRDEDRIFDPPTEEGLPEAEFGLFGRVLGKIETQRANVGGFTSNRAMVTVTIPF
jgi:hypothetical protein